MEGKNVDLDQLFPFMVLLLVVGSNGARHQSMKGISCCYKRDLEKWILAIILGLGQGDISKN